MDDPVWFGFFSHSSRYVALYNYRPQKSDELELCSGERYKVLEKGTDGWYKGYPILRRQQVGYFPGNYVRPIWYDFFSS